LGLWLGGEASWDGTPVNYEEYYPITYVVIGEAAMPIIRSIVITKTIAQSLNTNYPNLSTLEKMVQHLLCMPMDYI
jgi:hypothetical protein